MASRSAAPKRSLSPMGMVSNSAVDAKPNSIKWSSPKEHGSVVPSIEVTPAAETLGNESGRVDSFTTLTATAANKPGEVPVQTKIPDFKLPREYADSIIVGERHKARRTKNTKKPSFIARVAAALLHQRKDTPSHQRKEPHKSSVPSCIYRQAEKQRSWIGGYEAYMF